MLKMRVLSFWQMSIALLAFLTVGGVPATAGTFTPFGPQNYVRGSGAPVTETGTFTVLNPATQYTLKAFNGGLVNDQTELVSSTVVTVNGVQVLGESNFNQNVREVDVPVVLQGSNTISVQVRGQPGGTLTIEIIGVDNDPPLITANVSPAPNSAGWNKSDVTVTFTCTDATSGIANCPSPQTITSEVASQTISGTTTDNAGNSTSTSVTIKLDKTPPVVAIASPVNGSTISLSTISIGLRGSQSDTLSGVANVACNGSPAALSGGNFTCTVLLTQGPNSISVQATDVAGNSSSSPLLLTYLPAPQLAITAPANLNVTNLTPTTVRGTVSDPAATVTINGIPAPLSGGSFAIPVPLVEGLNVLTAVATNASGVASTATAQVTLDTTPPRITIDSPTDGSTTTSDSVTVSGLANDVVVGTVNAQDVQVTVNGITAQVGNRTYAALSVPLVLGKNTIQAIAHDRAGNGTTTNITVNRVLATQPPQPPIGDAVITQSLAIVSGNNQAGTIGAQLSTPLMVSLIDSSNHPVVNQPVVFKVVGNNGTVASGGTNSTAVAVNTDAGGHAQASWTLGQRAGAGNNTVQVSSPLAVGPVTFIATGSNAAAASIVVDSGNEQIGVLGQPLPFPFVADVVDSGHNRVPGVPVTFTVKQGDGTLSGSNTQTVNTDSNGRAIVLLTLGTQIGNANNVVEATFPDNPGVPAAFAASARAPGDPAATTVSGVVLDNSNNPIPGVTIRLFQTNQGNNNNLPVQVGTPVQTDAKGTFLIQSAPVGFFKLMADGTTATSSKTYPTLEYDIVTVAGNDNTVGMPIYLPALDQVNKLCVDETHGGTLTLPQVPGFALTVLPGSATFPGGSRQGCVTVTPVNGDKVPMSPGFGQQPRFIVTIQPVGTRFDPPAAMTLPNVDGLKPNAVTEMYSYDHDLGMFVAIGTGTVSADGSVIVSNPGVGVLKAGWHCGGDPNANGTVADCPTCKICQGNACITDPAQDQKTCQNNACKICSGGSCTDKTDPNTPFPANNSTLNGPVAASHTLGPTTYGLTFPESISTTISARCNGTNWSAVLNGLVGNYSQQVRLLPGQSEVTGPGGNTIQANFCAQATELKCLGNCGNPPTWYMLSAVQAHEDVHLTRFLPGLISAAPTIEASFDALSVPTASGKTQAQAVTEIQALPGWQAALTAGQTTWLNKVLALVAHDHDPGGPTDQAEHAVVDPMIARICEAARANQWGNCSACPADFTVTASPATNTVTAGGQVTFTVTIGAVNNFAGSVALSVSGGGTGVTGAISPATVTAPGTSTLTVTTTSKAAAGNYQFTITGTSGSLSHATSLAVTVK